MKYMEPISFSHANRQSVVDKHFRITCPHCSTLSGLSAISLPDYALATRYQPKDLGVAYQCDACKTTVFLRFSVRYDPGSAKIWLNEYSEVEQAKESYDFNYLPPEIAEDFREALTCYSNQCFNAFAAMCRRTIQSTSTYLGASGGDKVQRQIEDLKEVAEIDEDTFLTLKSIITTGHDGAHPHLPKLSSDRAETLLELIKDVLYQLIVRKKKIEEAAAKRKIAIEQLKNKD